MARKTRNGVSLKPGGGVRTLGPVADLERHLPADWWQTLFRSLYLKTDGDVVENDANTQREVDTLVRAAGLEPNDHLLDLCCGQGRHSLELARRGFRNVTGIDRSRYLIRLARARARQQGLPVVFREGDARKFRVKPSTYHCVAVMGNSFGYFDRDEDDVAVLQSIKRALKSVGTLVMDIADGDWMREHFERRSWEWIDQDHFVCRERSLDNGSQRLISREVVVHAERGVIADQFYAERLYTQADMQRVLSEVGFRGVRFHGVLEAESGRNQDLGMMARRLFLTAQAPQKRVIVAIRERPVTDVTVVLGDPDRPDMVKRNGVFNPEDFDTISRLKAALGELGEFRFRYLDNHATLLSDLRAEPPHLVFNLCDEGYRNNAFLELHVPAMLELLEIPYTGAGPACLGACYDKSLVRAIAAALDIPVPAETYYNPDDQAATLPAVFPALIKPNHGDSSLGITAQSVVHTPEEAINAIAALREQLPGRPLLLQEFLTGPEFSVGILGNPGQGYTALPVLEADYSRLDPGLPRILGYESKWIPDSPYWNQIRYREAEIDEETRRRLVDHSMLLFERLDCRDYARFDFRTDATGVVKLLEINPNPGWCWDGKLNHMAGFQGLRYADLLRMILEAARARLAAQRRQPEQQPKWVAEPAPQRVAAST
ncbi:MAG: methyltransferase domain-containing protein [Alphaproteobacteria bacterium]|nr:methyltransferase domain-containing protein [Alphaproteobacteria bacterium]